MKTMLSVDGKKILRVTEEKARELYVEGFRYIPKSMWKEQVRDIDKPTEEELPTKTKEKNNKMSRSTKRHLRKVNK